METLDNLTRDDATDFLSILRERFDWLKGGDIPIGCPMCHGESDAEDACMDLRILYNDLVKQRLQAR